MMPLLEKYQVYADYGTFALTTEIHGDLEFPTDLTDLDIKRGFRLEGESLIIYLPDLDSFQVAVEVYEGDWPNLTSESDASFVTEFSVGERPLKIYGLLDDPDNKPVLKMKHGNYECSGRGFFSEHENNFQILLRKKD